MPRTAPRAVPLGLLGRRRWTAAQAQDALARLDASGLSITAFAAQELIDVQRLYRWRSQLKRPAATPSFVEVKAIASAPSIEVVLGDGRVVRVAEGFSEDTLRRVLDVIDAKPARC